MENKKIFTNGTLVESYHLSPANAADDINQVATENIFNLTEEELKEVNENLKRFLNKNGKIIFKYSTEENREITYITVSGSTRRKIILKY